MWTCIITPFSNCSTQDLSPPFLLYRLCSLNLIIKPVRINCEWGVVCYNIKLGNYTLNAGKIDFMITNTILWALYPMQIWWRQPFRDTTHYGIVAEDT